MTSATPCIPGRCVPTCPHTRRYIGWALAIGYIYLRLLFVSGLPYVCFHGECYLLATACALDEQVHESIYLEENLISLRVLILDTYFWYRMETYLLNVAYFENEIINKIRKLQKLPHTCIVSMRLESIISTVGTMSRCICMFSVNKKQVIFHDYLVI